MTVQDDKNLVRQALDTMWNQGHVDAINSYFASTYIDHAAPMGEVTRDGYRQRIDVMRAAFPDLHLTIDDQVAEDGSKGGCKVVTRYHMSGTQKGSLMDIPASGRQINVSCMNESRIRNGKIEESWELLDQETLRQQLGASAGRPAR